MRQGKKNRRRLVARIDAWTELKAEGMHDPHNKIVRRPDGKPSHSYRKPGSQNGRK